MKYIYWSKYYPSEYILQLIFSAYYNCSKNHDIISKDDLYTFYFKLQCDNLSNFKEMKFDDIFEIKNEKIYCQTVDTFYDELVKNKENYYDFTKLQYVGIIDDFYRQFVYDSVEFFYKDKDSISYYITRYAVNLASQNEQNKNIIDNDIFYNISLYAQFCYYGDLSYEEVKERIDRGRYLFYSITNKTEEEK